MTPNERPRIEGDRELEILEATLEVLADVGYDRLTMDAVATRAKASKATLYRRWTNKVSLVIDALQHSKGPTEIPDTGSLREDLRGLMCCRGRARRPDVGRDVRGRADRHRPGRRVRRGVPRAGGRPQGRRLPADLGARPCAWRDPRGRRPDPARAGPGRHRPAPRVRHGRHARRRPDHPGDRPDPPAGRHSRPRPTIDSRPEGTPS